MRQRGPIALLLIVSTAFFLYPIANAISSAAGHPWPGPKVGSAATRAQRPGPPVHPRADQVRRRVRQLDLGRDHADVDKGTIYTPETLQKIDAITKSLDGWDYDARIDERKAEKQRLQKEGKKTKPRSTRSSTGCSRPIP